uniref:HAUS augmin-like complex subunit 6 N-terminal domain-containing protein n=1 Tax=Trichobilharzia regenti TaxID=157069 RepID=A0AA85J2I9_TRIRE|nr:unnamed protein product [Trichobilharzia regenti]
MPQDSLFLYAATVVRNLKILGYAFEAHNVPKDAASFSSFFKVCRKAEFIHMLHFLFQTLDPLKYEADKLSFLVGPKSEVKFKNAIYRWLRILSAEYPKIVSNFFAVWGYPAGSAVLRFLANLSTYVLCVTNNLTSCSSQCTETTRESDELRHKFFVDSCRCILSETKLRERLKEFRCTLHTEVHDKLKELTQCKQRILLDDSIQKQLSADCHSLCSDETIDLPEELITYQIQLKKKVTSLRQQLTEHLKNHAPSLLLLSNIVEELDEKEPCIQDGDNLKMPCAGLENFTSNGMAELKQDENGKLNLRLFLRHAIELFQLAVQSYTPLFINDTSNKNGETVFKQTVERIFSQLSVLKKYSYQTIGSSSSSLEVTLQSPSTDLTQLDQPDDKELAQLMKKMQDSINNLYADLQNEWLQGSYRQLSLRQIEMTDSKSSRPCLPDHQSSNKNSNSMKDKIYESFDKFLEDSQDESNGSEGGSASTSSISIGLSDSVHMSQISPGKSLDGSICQSDSRMNSTCTSPMESSSSSSAGDNNDSNAASNNDNSMNNTISIDSDNNNNNNSEENNTTVNVSLSPEEHSFYTTPKYFNSSPSSSSTSSFEQQEVENDLQKLSINPTDTISVPQKVSRKSSSNQLKTSFNLMDDDLDFVNDLLPSSPN